MNVQVCRSWTPGARSWSRTMHEETLTWITPTSRSRAVALHRLGMLAQRRWDYAAAETHYRTSLTIKEDGDRSGMSKSYHHRHPRLFPGDYPSAETHYRKSLAIKEELGDRSGVATSSACSPIIGGLPGRGGRLPQRPGYQGVARRPLRHCSLRQPDGYVGAEQETPRRVSRFRCGRGRSGWEMHLPQAGRKVRWLRADSAAPGEHDFAAALGDVLDPNVQFNLLELLDQSADPADGDGTIPSMDPPD